MGRTGEVYATQPGRKRLDKHLEVQPAGPESHTDYLRTWSRHFTHVRPGRKGDLLREWQILRVPDCISCLFKTIDGHCSGERHCACHLARWEARDVRYTHWTAEDRTLGVGHRRQQQSKNRHRNNPWNGDL